jgi:hypothetical protein
MLNASERKRIVYVSKKVENFGKEHKKNFSQQKKRGRFCSRHEIVTDITRIKNWMR